MLKSEYRLFQSILLGLIMLDLILDSYQLESIDSLKVLELVVRSVESFIHFGELRIAPFKEIYSGALLVQPRLRKKDLSDY